jgi:predicted nuclease with TOPRIM domain
MLTEKFTIEQGLVKNLQDENNRLRSEVQEKDKQLNKLTEMKSQDTEIIMGLKDIISNLTISLKEKDASYKDVQEKYVDYL